ncbi:alpha-amylase family glycosyl hydrolase [Aquibacillus koreensis]|uniref:Alpha-amylase family glycosyl hydrolase n=1 Tax=Aquibacillus koreensis TaxID=279446 RepID=A0A9X4AJ46_9BACI|nr:alpha-amylase family glycosyl hydrolase [Aquibacillus koreensis]MCT2535615.1 alpha-amylase family glycosyl hydrolase [Aquibacillus koreensis]MDC3420100.1 alpha-amylase family glycosyl hydrolase [Aquibacillus koreensis]
MKKYTSLSIILLVAWIAVMLPKVEVQAESMEEESVYYIMVDRFVNGDVSNDRNVDVENNEAFNGGDIQGIIKKLDYIKQLGFTTINISPIMSNDAYHGFYINDYRSIDHRFGTVDDLKELVAEAHKRDIKVIIDMVLTHVSKTHPWLGSQPNWIGDSISNSWGDDLASLNTDNPDLQSYLIETTLYWMEETDIDGYRIYVDDTTPITFIESLQEEVHLVHPNAILFVDSFHPVESNPTPIINDRAYKISTTVFSKSGNDLQPLVDLWDSQSNKDGVYLDNQETTRFTREAVKEGENPTTRWKLALTYLYTTPGIPVIYQGTESTMDNGMDLPDHRTAQLNSGDEDLRNYMEQLAAIREEFPAISHGDIELVEHNNAMTLYKRMYKDETVYVAINNDTTTRVIGITDIPEGMQLNGLLQDNIVREQKDGEYKIALQRETADIFVIQEDQGMNWLFISFVVLVLGGFVVTVILLSRKNKQNDEE